MKFEDNKIIVHSYNFFWSELGNRGLLAIALLPTLPIQGIHQTLGIHWFQSFLSKILRRNQPLMYYTFFPFGEKINEVCTRYSTRLACLLGHNFET